MFRTSRGECTSATESESQHGKRFGPAGIARLGDAEIAGVPIVVLDVPLLFETGGEKRVEVLHGVSFRVEPGQLVALVGSSGAGKSASTWSSKKWASSSPTPRPLSACTSPRKAWSRSATSAAVTPASPSVTSTAPA